MKKRWEVKRLGEVCDIIGGGTPSKANSNFYRGSICWATVRDMRNDVINETEFKITREAVKNSSTNIISKGNVIIATRVGLGKICLIKNDTAINQDLRGIIPKDHSSLLSVFLFHWFKSIAHLIAEAGTGATVQGVKLTFVKDLSIPLPPISEQKRIVSILDESFVAIDKAKANAEQNLKNAKELFESYLQGVFEKKGDGWEEKRLKNVCELKPPKKEARDKLKQSDLVTFLPMEDLGVLDKYIFGTKQRELKDVIGSYTYFSNNDVLLAKITPCFENGKIGIASNLTNGVGFGSSEYFVFRTGVDIQSNFLYYFLSRESFRKEGRKFMTGAVGHKRVSKDWIENYLISFPRSLKTQEEIVKQLDILSTETQKLEVTYQKKIDDLEELKKSILQKAFSGELSELGCEGLQDERIRGKIGQN